MAITDHDYLWEAAELESILAVLEGAPLVVFRGQEVTCSDGHLLVFGTETGIEPGDPRLEVARRVHDLGGATILAHPFRWGGYAKSLDSELAGVFGTFSAVEGWTTNHGATDLERVQNLVGRPGIRFVGASDAHSLDRVGVFATSFDGAIRKEAELAKALRTGRVSPVRRSTKGEYVPCISP